MLSIHVNWARKDQERSMVKPCPTCERRRLMYGWLQHWYGWHVTCTGCGDEWTDGEMHERPFRPRWRAENIASAKGCIRALRKGGG